MCISKRQFARSTVPLISDLSSICVATTTGLPCARHSSMMFFCRMGTSSGAHSTPRSPRATTGPRIERRDGHGQVCGRGPQSSAWMGTRARTDSVAELDDLLQVILEETLCGGGGAAARGNGERSQPAARARAAD